MTNQKRTVSWQPITVPVLTLSLLLGYSACSGTGSQLAATKPSSDSAPAGSWSNVHPTGSVPLPRDGHWMAYDSTNGTVILFGGKGNRSQYFNDTWAYTPATNTWHELTPTSILPPGRFGHSIVYDPARRELLLFGGVVGTTGQSANDLWAYSFKTNTWTHLHPADAGPAQARRLRPGAGRQPGKRQRLAAAVARRPPAGTYPSPLQPRSARATRPDRDGQRNGHAHRLNQPAPASPVRSS